VLGDWKDWERGWGVRVSHHSWTGLMFWSQRYDLLTCHVGLIMKGKGKEDERCQFVSAILNPILWDGWVSTVDRCGSSLCFRLYLTKFWEKYFVYPVRAGTWEHKDSKGYNRKEWQNQNYIREYGTEDFPGCLHNTVFQQTHENYGRRIGNLKLY